MREKKSGAEWITIDQIIEVFQKRLDRADAARAMQGPPDPNLPRVPYRVEEIEPVGSNTVAHFRRYYKDPDEVICSLTLDLPDFKSRKK